VQNLDIGQVASKPGSVSLLVLLNVVGRLRDLNAMAHAAGYQDSARLIIVGKYLFLILLPV